MQIFYEQIIKNMKQLEVDVSDYFEEFKKKEGETVEEIVENIENKTISNVREQPVFAIKDNGELATGLMIRYEIDAGPNDDELFIGSSTEQKITVVFDCDIADVNGWVTLGKISGEAKVATDLLEVIQNPLDLTKKIFKNKEFDKYGWLNFNAAEIKAKIEKSKTIHFQLINKLLFSIKIKTE